MIPAGHPQRARLEKLRRLFDGLGIDAFLVTFLPHLRYFSGFSGSSGIGLVTRKSASFVTDGRYAQQIRNEVKGWQTFIAPESSFEEIRKQKLIRPGWRVAVDGNALILSHYKQLKKLFPAVRFVPKVDVVEQIASIKDASEIDSIKKAVLITDKVFLEILELIAPDVSELDIAAEISYRQRRHGADGDAFEPIVVSGERGALPHGKPTAKKVRRGEFVTLDFGCVVHGYHSDLTRTIALGRPSPEARKIHDVVLTAQLRAIEAAKSGIKASELDAVARNYIKAEGYDKHFRHSLGHGLGLQIHEAPRISVQSKAILAAGNVVTIEPGIYVPKLGGVRIEDDIVIADGQCEILNRSPKNLIIV
jgi:Xaa-Pro aminopeptidase